MKVYAPHLRSTRPPHHGARLMRDADPFWLALAVTGTAVELWAVATKRDHLTLSKSARRALRCHTKAGRALTTIAIGGGSAWLANHLLTVNPEETP